MESNDDWGDWNLGVDEFNELVPDSVVEAATEVKGELDDKGESANAPNPINPGVVTLEDLKN